LGQALAGREGGSTQTLECSVNVGSEVLTLDEVRDVWGSGVSNNQPAHVKVVIDILEGVLTGHREESL
jgi:hypothetical protein